MKVQDMCTKGNAEACKRVKFTETGSFAGGIRGGALAGVLTVPLVGWTLRALTVSTRCLGGVACGYCSSWRWLLCRRRICRKGR
jgi:hypothetical protein